MQPERRQAWVRALVKTALWFCAGLILTYFIASRITAHPVLVQTPSIDTGVYWVDTRVKRFRHNDLVAFEFIARSQALIKAGFTSGLHVKQIAGVPGDTVRADQSGRVLLCPAGASECTPVGTPREFDSKGRPLTAWLEPGAEIVLQAKQYWVYAPHPRSLDSRYNGPIHHSQVKGRATPLYIWGRWQDHLDAFAPSGEFEAASRSSVTQPIPAPKRPVSPVSPLEVPTVPHAPLQQP